MTDQEISELFSEMYNDFQHTALIFAQRPLLAHYTSLQVVEKISKDEEIWFSNPLFMNDLEEVRFGLLTEMSRFTENEDLDRACRTAERADMAVHYLKSYFSTFENEHAVNVYVFCLSEHDLQDNDGRLSMWRAYGGSGNGAAMVFKTESINIVHGSPLLFAKVQYASQAKRIQWIDDKINQWCNIVSQHDIPDDKLYLASYHLLQIFQLFALTWKHDGFREEQEWRVIYMPERDTEKMLHDSFGYIISNRGVEPKLKYKIKPLPIATEQTISLATLLDRIILGPTVSSALAKQTFCRMLRQIGRAEFESKVFSSSIPLRPT